MNITQLETFRGQQQRCVEFVCLHLNTKLKLTEEADMNGGWGGESSGCGVDRNPHRPFLIIASFHWLGMGQPAKYVLKLFSSIRAACEY